MTTTRAKKLLPIMVAFAEGKTIQRRMGKNDEWGDVKTSTKWRDDFDYRIKPNN